MKSWKLLGTLACLGALLAAAQDAAARPVKQALQPTMAAKNAQGRVVVSLHHAGKTMQGKMLVVGHNLSPNATFGVNVRGVHIGKFTTNGAGSGAARFSSQPTGHAQFLGVDPAGMLVEVSDDQGEDVMETEMPDDSGAGDIQCCLPDECEETSPDECAAENGTNMGAGSCFPDPCPTTPPSGDIVCCVPDAGEGDCNEESPADCAAENGINMGAVACDPDPCAPVSSPNIVQCCVSQGDQGEQEGEPQPEPPDCEELTAADCAAANGTAVGTGACDPNPCSAPAITTTTTMP